MSVSAKEGFRDGEPRFGTCFFLEESPVTFNNKPLSWKNVIIPSSVKIHPIAEKLRSTQRAIDECVEEMPSKLNLSDSSDASAFGDVESGVEDASTGQPRREGNVFSKEVTESEKDIIQQRVALQQKQFAEFERRDKERKFKKVVSMYDYLSTDELEEMLKDCNNDEEEIVVRLTQNDYLQSIRRAIALKYAPEVENQRNKMSSEQMEAYQQLLKKRSSTLKKTTTDTAKKHYRMTGRLALDDALKQVEENGKDADKAFEGWSSARIRAYQMIHENPNSYYYRFNAPGEVQQKGQWGPKEKELFFKRLDEIGANGQWGIFAMTIPGRVGYQCSNFYRLLIETGQVEDPNYVLDEKGKAHYLFDKKTAGGGVEKTFRTHVKQSSGKRTSAPAAASSSSSAATTAAASSGTRAVKRRRRGEAPQATSVKKKKKRRSGWDSEEEDDDFEDYNDTSGTYTASTRSSSRRARSSRVTYAEASDPEDAANDNGGMTSNQDDDDENAADEFDENPLPGLIDPITLDEVVKPAISKYGHVMGYDSWVRCLTNWEGKKNICPLTKKTLTKRDLVILTHENIEEYRDQIKND
ncbi:hypothetical protein BC940DRAFT_296732 [Gongronella butleri]|nr:hypothetical protein BC940DRAFT_296732 [Gongronella butleri]